LLAGPGTGKTHQLAMRVKYLVEELEAKPGEIAVITFTTEAARNMRERLSRKDINIPKESHPNIIATTHKLGNMIIGSRPEQVDLSEVYSVLPSSLSQIKYRYKGLFADISKNDIFGKEATNEKVYS